MYASLPNCNILDKKNLKIFLNHFNHARSENFTDLQQQLMSPLLKQFLILMQYDSMNKLCKQVEAQSINEFASHIFVDTIKCSYNNKYKRTLYFHVKFAG